MDFKDFLNIVKEPGFLKHADNSYNAFPAILHTQTHTTHPGKENYYRQFSALLR